MTKTKEYRGKKKDVCPFLLLENSRPLFISSSGTPDFLPTCLGIDSLSSACVKRPEEASPERQCRDGDRGWGVTTSGYSSSF